MVLRCYGGTLPWYGGGLGSTPSLTSEEKGLLVEEEDAAVARRKSGCNSPAVHWSRGVGKRLPLLDHPETPYREGAKPDIVSRTCRVTEWRA